MTMVLIVIGAGTVAYWLTRGIVWLDGGRW